ncbi:MAG: response regulator [Proteobacteria bacterium]|nr:response regulator [Pseudomonadota bacterium]
MKTLVVDDDSASRFALELFTRSMGHEVLVAADGKEAWDCWRNERPRIVVTDWIMPDLDGIQLCSAIRKNEGDDYTYIIMVSTQDRKREIIAGFQAGADDYITKPFNREELVARLKVGERVLNLQTKDLLIFALAKLAESRDTDTGSHLERIRHYSRVLTETIAERLGAETGCDRLFIENIFLTSPLHDVGKVGIPDRILLKPGPLDDAEFEIMKQHTVIGYRTLREALLKNPKAGYLRMSAEIARSHHERYDGRGYPDRLAGEDIPLSARIVALADAYDAIRSKRVYKEALDHETAASIIGKDAGSHFDPMVAEAFFLAEDRFLSIHDAFQEPGVSQRNDNPGSITFKSSSSED